MKLGKKSDSGSHAHDDRHDDTRHNEPYDERHHDERHRDERHRDTRSDDYTRGASEARDAEARDRFGGTNIGAAFFGWLVAIAMTVLLASIVGAVATAVGASQNVTQSEAEQEAGTIGIVAAAILIAIMLIAYFTGGYVAGRMSRFDGGRQGLAVWLIGLLITVLAVGLGLLFGSEYNILEQIDMPQIPIPTNELSTAGIITALAIVIGTAIAAMAGGKVGHRYHDKVDRVAYRS